MIESETMNNNPEIRNEVLDGSGHFQEARRILADELRLRFDHSIKDEDLMPETEIRSPFREDSYFRTFMFSIGQGFGKITFAIRFQVGYKGNPIFKLKKVDDPSLSCLRLKGVLTSHDKGRGQIERVLAVERNLAN